MGPKEPIRETTPRGSLKGGRPAMGQPPTWGPLGGAARCGFLVPHRPPRLLDSLLLLLYKEVPPSSQRHPIQFSLSHLERGSAFSELHTVEWFLHQIPPP